MSEAELRDRLTRATDIPDSDVEQLGPLTVEVESQSGNGTYRVDFTDPDNPSCECPDHVYRGTTCKHLAKAADTLGVIDL